MNEEIDKLIDLCKSQNRVAQKQLYELTYRRLHVAVAVFIRDPTQRDWVFNQGMLQIFTSFDRFSIGTNYFGWARTILTRAAVDYLRKQKTHLSVISSIDSSEVFDQGHHLNTSLDQLLTQDIIKLLHHLPDSERMIFTLFEIEGYTHVEIENLFNVNRNTSKWLLAKAKKQLRKMITDYPSIKNFIYG